MKFSFLLAVFATFHALTFSSFAQDVIRPNPQVEAKAAQALLDAEIKLQKSITLNSQKKPAYERYGNYFNEIAIAFARLGRTESALKATKFTNNASETQSEVLRLSVRRSALLGDVKRAESLIPQIKNNNAKADALLTVARAHLRNNDYNAAQKVLFQVTPLVPENFNALLYTASLFAESGNMAVSKRLFDRAKAMLEITSTSETDEREDQKRFDGNLGKINSYSISIINAGLISEWQEFRKNTIIYSRDIDSRVLTALLERNEIDLGIEEARQSSDPDEVATLCIIAYYIAPGYPDRAYSLLGEASDILPLDYTKLENRYGKEKLLKIKQSLSMFLAYGYKKLGKEEDSQKWLQQLEQDTPPKERALAYLKYYIMFHSMSGDINDKSTFTPEELLRVNSKIQPYLREVHDKGRAFFLLSFLINAQIDAGQIAQATSNIMYLEQYAKQQMQPAKDRMDFSEALSVASLWKDAGNQKQLDAILQTIFNAPQKIPFYSKLDRIRDFISRGFVDEGLQFFYSLPIEGKKPPQSVIPDLPYALATAHPDEFPYELLKAKQPYTEARNISKFVHGLTNTLFQTPSERAFVINSNGGTGN